MNIIQQIDKYLNVESLRSRELFSRFDLLVKQEEWYYVNAHPAPAGVTPVQGPRKAWRWNASMARAAGVSEADIASATGDKAVAQMAEARAAAQPAMPAATPVDGAVDDVFEDWETFTATHRKVTSKELSIIKAQLKAAGLGDGKDSGTVFTEALAKVNEKGEITHATTMDGQLHPVNESVMENGRVLRTGVKFNTSVDAENQLQYFKADIGHFRKTGKNKLEKINFKNRAYADTKAGKKAGILSDLTEVYPDLMGRITRDINKPKSVTKIFGSKKGEVISSKTVREAAFALALIDHTYKRIGGGGGKSNVIFDGKEGRRFKIDAVATKKAMNDLKKKGIKFTKDSKGRIWTKATRGAKKGKPQDNTKYVRGAITTYGITDFLPKHVKQDANGNVSIVFPGKDGVVNNSPIKDPFLAKELIKRKKQGGFGRGKTIVNTDAGTVRDYVKSASGKESIVPHKFRTYHATRLAGDVIKSIGDAPKISAQALNKELRKENTKKIKQSGKGYSADELKNIATIFIKNQQLDSVVDLVGSKVAPNLGHKPKICVDEYISKTVFEETGWQKQFDDEIELHTSKNLIAAARQKKSKTRKKKS